MIAKKLIEIIFSDIEWLVDNQVPESRTLEYKSILPKNGDEDRKEFLADVSAFANTDWWDLIYGISEIDKLLAISSIEITSTDEEIRRLEAIIQSGLTPRVDAHIKAIETPEKKYIFIIRIRPNFGSPHRVVLKNSNRFFKRISTSKIEMDVNDLRTAFIQTSNIAKNAHEFRKERVFMLKTKEILQPSPEIKRFLMCHIIPIWSMLGGTSISNLQLQELNTNILSFEPMHCSGWSSRINLDGFYANSKYWYAQLFRNGIVEDFSCELLWTENKLRMLAIENVLIQHVSDRIVLMKKLDLQPPFYIFLTLIGVENCYIDEDLASFGEGKITVPDIYLPEVIVHDFEEDIGKVMKPTFDTIWNAAWISRSYGYDMSGSRTS